MTTSNLRIVIVGAGPVACLAAIEMLRRGCQVTMVDRGPDIRDAATGKAYSFNLTLTYRGLVALQPKQRARLYDIGVVLTHRVIHRTSGDVLYQPYGASEAEHLLSVPRQNLHRVLLEDAVAGGAEVLFDRTCVDADVRVARATFLDTARNATVVEGDYLFGCDGANSVVRHNMTRYGGRMRTRLDYVPHGHVELDIEVPRKSAAALHRNPTVVDEFGMHLWPRENFFLQAQPNKGGGYTVALFMPLCENNDSLIFRYLPPRHQIRAFFEEQFPDIAEYLPSVVRDTYDARPAQLRTVRCDPFHHGRTVLLGDAAHTIVPFYGQGINCSFEDISTLASMFDECRLASGSASRGMARAIKRFSEIRVDPDHAIADLSLSNLHELSSASADERFQQRKAIEVRLAREDPDHFRTLYEMVAFTSLPYHRVIERDHLQAALLDELCSRHDLARDAELIAREYTLAIRAALSGRHTLRQRVLGRSVPDPAVDLARALLTDAVGLTDQRAVDDTVVTTRRHGVAPAGHAARPAR